MFKVTIAELFNSTEVNTEKSTVEMVRYEQTTDTLDLKAVIDAVNRVPPQPPGHAVTRASPAGRMTQRGQWTIGSRAIPLDDARFRL